MRHDFYNKKLVIFDWDGTLFDSTGVIAHALQQSCAAINRPIPSLKQAQHVIGLGFTEAIEALTGPLDATQTEQFMQSYRRHYFGGEEVVTLFDGISELLTALRARGVLTAIATGKSRAGLNRVLQHSMLKNQFDASRTADETTSKPHPMMLLELLEELDIAAHDAVMIGDTTYDIDMAHAAGVSAIAVAYGAHDIDTLNDRAPHALALSATALKALFESKS